MPNIVDRFGQLVDDAISKPELARQLLGGIVPIGDAELFHLVRVGGEHCVHVIHHNAAVAQVAAQGRGHQGKAVIGAKIIGVGFAADKNAHGTARCGHDIINICQKRCPAAARNNCCSVCIAFPFPALCQYAKG